jgi:hypothetical protein
MFVLLDFRIHLLASKKIHILILLEGTRLAFFSENGRLASLQILVAGINLKVFKVLK